MKARKSIKKVSRKPARGGRGALPRWALTNDGAFVLIGIAIEIPRLATRALVDFVRTLDKGSA